MPFNLKLAEVLINVKKLYFHFMLFFAQDKNPQSNSGNI